jgi:hypothetical protein
MSTAGTQRKDLSLGPLSRKKDGCQGSAVIFTGIRVALVAE